MTIIMFPRDALGWSAAYDCGIYRPYSLTFMALSEGW